MKKMFTFNELIIVAVITVIGFCSIAAVTENAAKKSSLAICADNMKKIAQAATQYAHDNNNTLPGTTYKVGVNWQLRIAPYLGYKNIKPVITLLKSGCFGLYDAFAKLIDGNNVGCVSVHGYIIQK